MNILVLGRSGQVGHELQRSLAPLGTVTALGRSEADLSQPDSLADVVREARADVIVIAAAYTAVDRAETERALAFRVNTESVGMLAQCAAELERSGMSRVEAIAEANRRFGNFDSHFEACRREAPEERMNRAMKIGMVAMTVVLLAAVAAGGSSGSSVPAGSSISVALIDTR